MEIIIAILLYLNIIQSPGTYTTTQLNDNVKTYSVEVDRIKKDNALMDVILRDYKDQINGITVIDDSLIE